MDFQKIPYLMRRDDGTQASGNPREAIINDLQGSMRNSVNNFTFSDMVTAKQPSDFYLRPFYNLSTVLKRPEHATVLFKLTGASQDKIQFFSKAYLLGSSTAVASILFDKKYEGDMLFYQSLGRDRAGVKDEGKGLDLSKDERLSIPYKVLDFSPNQIVISIDIAQNGVWMQYADTWHPSWKATINGKPQELYIGSLAYKALPLERGKNIIRLYVESKPVVFLYGFMMLSSLVWILILIGLIIQ